MIVENVTLSGFTGSGTPLRFTLADNYVPPPLSIDYLIVAGGGGGGRGDIGGGGAGAGGYLTTIGSSRFTPTLGTQYTITIGAGGGYNVNGTNSSAFGLTSYGGGKGGNGLTGANGGSGGAGAKGVYPGSTYIDAPRQGYDGGSAGGYGSGGGAGGAGSGLTGGPGVSNDITGTSYTYCSGGPGSNGSTYYSGPPVGALTGSGNYGDGGSGLYNVGAGNSGNGIVVIRYGDTYPAATTTTGSPNYTVSGGYRRYVFTSSGSITF